MASGNSREITTSQVGIHDKLDDLVKKYQASENKRPISDHTQAAFDDVSAWLDGFSGEIILDSCWDHVRVVVGTCQEVFMIIVKSLQDVVRVVLGSFLGSCKHYAWVISES